VEGFKRFAAIASMFVLALAMGCEDDEEKKGTETQATQQKAGSEERPDNPGVTDNEIKVGMNAAFSGPSVGLGVEMWRGAKLAFEEANAKGGVSGRKLELVLADDGYESERAGPAILKLITEENVFCTGWSVGTPTIVETLPIILKYHESEDFFHFGCFTGAQPQRTPPENEAVFNVRASYQQETASMVNAFVDMGLKKIGVFIQNDAYGIDGREGTKKALRSHGLDIIAEQRYERGQKYDEDYSKEMKTLRDAGTEAIIMVGSYQACGGAIRDARKMGWNAPIHNVSFVGAEQMLTFLKKSRSEVPNILENLIVTQVVPHYEQTDLPAVQAYRTAMDKYNPRVPELAAGAGYKPSGKYSFGSLEGYLTGQVFLKVLDKVGRDLTREEFIAVAETGMGDPAPEPETSAEGGEEGEPEGAGEGATAQKKAPAVAKPRESSFDIGVGVPASFGPNDHQALDKVWFTYATPDGWDPTDDVSEAVSR
jgi:ABC-type branched-subunit amino acid transport system substrate-binding protein